MKYLKLFENINEPQIGDYVLCKEMDSNDKKLLEFIDNNVGRIVDTKPETDVFTELFVIKYKNIPFDNNWQNKNTRYFLREEILFWSKDKEDCEAFLNAKKYNI
jgi:hypothetical protein